MQNTSSANRGDNEKNQAERGGFHCFPLLLSWEDLKGTAKKKFEEWYCIKEHTRTLILMHKNAAAWKNYETSR